MYQYGIELLNSDRDVLEQECHLARIAGSGTLYYYDYYYYYYYTAVKEKQTIQQLPVHLLVLAQLCLVLSVSAAYYTDFLSTPTSRSPALTPDHSTVHTHTTVPVALKHDRKMQCIICAPSCKVKTMTDHQTHRPI